MRNYAGGDWDKYPAGDVKRGWKEFYGDCLKMPLSILTPFKSARGTN